MCRSAVPYFFTVACFLYLMSDCSFTIWKKRKCWMYRPSRYKVKRISAWGGYVGGHRRRRTCKPAKSSGEEVDAMIRRSPNGETRAIYGLSLTEFIGQAKRTR